MPYAVALVALLAGAAQVLAFAPWGLWWLQPLSLAVLVFSMRKQTPARAAVQAWLFAWAWLGLGWWWLFNSLHRYGGLPAALSIAAVAVLAGLLALYYALAAAGWAAGRRGIEWIDALAFAAWWLAADLARATLFTGFPWIATGYAQTDGPLAAWAPYIGVYGIGALVAGCAAALAFGAAAWRRASLRALIFWWLAPAAVCAIGAALPGEFTRSTGTIAVSLLQTNVAQDEKFDAAHIQAALNWHALHLAQATGDLVVTPESSLPLLPVQIAPSVWNEFERPYRAPGRGALVGIFTGDDEHGYTNSVIGLSAAGHVPLGTEYVYGKRHLLPFGEFVPPGFKWLVEMMRIPIGDQARGTRTAPFEVAGQRVRPLICYEDLFGEDFAAGVVGPNAATLLANVTNLAWFDSPMAQAQHLQFSRMRALEFQRPQVRATNTGATAVLDHRGRITSRLAPDVEGVLEARVEGRIGDTPYAAWLARAGLGPLWAVAALLALASRALRGPEGRRRSALS